MLRLITFWLLALSTLGAAAAPAPLFARITADLQAEARAAARQGQLLAVFLTLPDCPGCREMERSVHADPATVKAIGRQFRSVRLDIAGEAPITDARGETTTPGQLAQRLRAVATPSYAFFDGRGQVRYRYTGTLDTTGFRQLATYVARGDYEHRPFVPPTRSPSAAAPASMKLHAAPPAATLPIRPAFTLAATDGKTYRHGDFNGRVLALAVGYTQCPDVCPTTLAELKAAVEALPPALRLAVQPAFVTLDPERDSLPLLAEYAAAFRPAGGRPILGLRGNRQQTAELIGQLQLVADKQPSASMGYTLDHTAGVFLFAADGRLLGLSPYGQDLSELAADLRTLATAARPAAARPLAQH